MPEYDYTAEKWIDSPVRVRASSRVHPLNSQRPATRENVSKPKFSLVEWFIIGPMVVGLGFMAGVMWP